MEKKECDRGMGREEGTGGLTVSIRLRVISICTGSHSRGLTGVIAFPSTCRFGVWLDPSDLRQAVGNKPQRDHPNPNPSPNTHTHTLYIYI